MVYYAIGLVLMAIASGSLTWVLCSNVGRKEYSKGWDAAKALYYDDILKAQKEEEKKVFEDLNEENTKNHFPISAELLAAYGVSTVGQLPINIKEYYNITEEQEHFDLEILTALEEKNNNG